jgi:hypothetical protein
VEDKVDSPVVDHLGVACKAESTVLAVAGSMDTHQVAVAWMNPFSNDEILLSCAISDK